MIERVPLPCPELQEVLLEAFRPCENFGTCEEAIWAPEDGHVPRGFLGATGKLSDVRVIIVCAEPGHPHQLESYDSRLSSFDLMQSVVNYVYKGYSEGLDPFHRNLRWFLDQIWPDLTFREQLKYVWLTEGRLCSIKNEIGQFSDKYCAPKYLKRQLSLMPEAEILAFGGKARRRVGNLAKLSLKLYALSPPGANRRAAMPTWEEAVQLVRSQL